MIVTVTVTVGIGDYRDWQAWVSLSGKFKFVTNATGKPRRRRPAVTLVTAGDGDASISAAAVPSGSESRVGCGLGGTRLPSGQAESLKLGYSSCFKSIPSPTVTAQPGSEDRGLRFGHRDRGSDCCWQTSESGGQLSASGPPGLARRAGQSLSAAQAAAPGPRTEKT